MLEEVIKIADENFKPEKALEYALSIWKYQKWFSHDKDKLFTDWYLDKIENIGLENVDKIKIPADGKTFMNGVGFPKLWSVKNAVLKITSPIEAEIANYEKNPCNLMLYSHSTPAEGFKFTINKEREIESGGSVFGKISPEEGNDLAVLKGVRMIVSDWIEIEKAKKTGKAHWNNFTVNPFYSKNAAGFAVDCFWGERIRELLKKGESISFVAKIDTEFQEGCLDIPTGVIPGESEEEIIITGHLFEPGIYDNASSNGVMLHLAEMFCDLIRKGQLPKPKRTIRLLPSFEARSSQAYIYKFLHNKVVAGLCMDGIADNREIPVRLVQLPKANPSLHEYLLQYLYERLCKVYGFKWNKVLMWLNDSQFSDPLVNIPTPGMSFFNYGENNDITYWHNNYDSPDHLNLDILKTAMKMFGVIAASYCHFFIYPEKKMIDYLGEKTIEILKSENPSRFRVGKVKDSFNSFYKANSCKPDHIILDMFDKFLEQFEKHDKDQVSDENIFEKTNKLIPRRFNKGFVGFDNLDDNEMELFFKEISHAPFYVSPEWLSEILFMSDGSKSMSQILNILKKDGLNIDVEKAIKYLFFLKHIKNIEMDI
jgi:hypothetical protein